MVIYSLIIPLFRVVSIVNCLTRNHQNNQSKLL